MDGYLPLQVDDWMMVGLYGGNFSGKGKIIWCCATRALLCIFGMKEIVGCLTISVALLILFRLLCNIQLLGDLQTTNYADLFCHYSLLMIIN